MDPRTTAKAAHAQILARGMAQADSGEFAGYVGSLQNHLNPAKPRSAINDIAGRLDALYDQLRNARAPLMECSARLFGPVPCAGLADSEAQPGAGALGELISRLETLAELATEVEALRALTWKCVEAHCNGEDVTRLASLGWRARIGLREGLAQTYQSFLAEQAAGTLRG